MSIASMLPAALGSRRMPYPVHLVETARLRDGTPFTIRPVGRCDLRLERTFVAALSPQSRYQRLLSGRKLQPGELRRLTDIDYGHELALIAVATLDGREQILGEARYVRDDSHGAAGAEFAVVIGDRWQGHGLGETLLRRLLRAAADEGIGVMGGITLSENHRMIALARKLGFRAHREPGDASVTTLRRDVDDAHVASLAAMPAFDEALLWELAP
jgi:acetyltransferase